MIKPNELRIGNCVIHNNKHVLIREVCNYSVQIRDSETNHVEYVELSKIHSIPLTEEILLKCGFVDDLNKSESKYYSHSANTLDLAVRIRRRGENLDIYELSANGVGVCVAQKVVKSLHHLQNLYFALTEELEINPERVKSDY